MHKGIPIEAAVKEPIEDEYLIRFALVEASELKKSKGVPRIACKYKVEAPKEVEINIAKRRDLKNKFRGRQMAEKRNRKARKNRDIEINNSDNETASSSESIDKKTKEYIARIIRYGKAAVCLNETLRVGSPRIM